MAPANFVDWRRESRAFASLAAFDEFRPTLTSASEPEVLRAVSASGSFFTTLGVTAALGRTLVPSDDQAGAESVVVLSDGLWRRAFSAAPDVIGRSLAIDQQPHTIVGVMAEGFESPLQSGVTDVWANGDRGVPRTFPFQDEPTAVRDSHLLYVVGRLSPGVSRDAAQRELTTLMLELSRRYPATNAGLGVNVKSLHEQVVGDVRRLVTLLQLAVGMMLLIACANVAHLLLGQAAGRCQEMSTRLALGAKRGRLIRQVLGETLVLAVPGGVVGVLLATWGLQALIAARPQGLPRVDDITLDASVLAFTCSVTLLTALVFGLGPAIQLARHASLQGHSDRRTTAARSVRRWHHAIVIGELAVAQVLLLGAGLLPDWPANAFRRQPGARDRRRGGRHALPLGRIARRPDVFLPIGQNAERWPFLSFTVWTDGEPAASIGLLRAAIREADPQQAVMRIRSFDDVLSASLVDDERFRRTALRRGAAIHRRSQRSPCR